MTAPDLQLLRVPTMSIGYGRMGMMVDEAIRRLGVTVSNDIEGDPAGTVLLCSTPAHLRKYRKGQRLTVLTMWESMNLPEAFRESLHLFDTVIVPSEQNVELFSAYHDNVHYVPLGIDPQVWKPTPRKPFERRFVFLVGGSGPRKGVDLAYKAFRAAFPDGSWGDGPEPWLYIKSPRTNPFHGERIMQINGKLSDEDEVALYADAHCYLQPSRGEGFGLQPLQALAQGCPTILTAAHGHMAFARYGLGVSATATNTIPGSFMYGEAGQWWEPSLDELTAQMRHVYDQYELERNIAWTNAAYIGQSLTWDRCAEGILGALPLLAPYVGDGSWLVPEQKLYRVVLNRHHAADIAGSSYRWEPFTDYYVPADIKRILFDGGFLDPSCVIHDPGLTPAEIASAELPSGADSFCGTCHQRLGSQPTRADIIEQELNHARS